MNTPFADDALQGAVRAQGSGQVSWKSMKISMFRPFLAWIAGCEDDVV
jgi:hypothetical protein